MTALLFGLAASSALAVRRRLPAAALANTLGSTLGRRDDEDKTERRVRESKGRGE